MILLRCFLEIAKYFENIQVNAVDPAFYERFLAFIRRESLQ